MCASCSTSGSGALRVERAASRGLRAFAAGLAALGFGSASLAQDVPEVRIESRPGPLLYFANGGDEPCQVRIVDAVTERPLPGALLYVVRERTHPTGGEFWFDSKWQADADGFVQLPGQAVPERCWILVAADGYGPLAECRMPPWAGHCVALMPGIDWQVDLRDAFDQPLANVEVGLCLGCGHTPDVRVATSDQNGRVVLRGVEPDGTSPSGILDLYPRGPGLASEYHGASWRLGDPPTQLRLEASNFVRGRIRSPNGRPLPGLWITSDRQQHRGPWSQTDADGAFLPIAFVDRLAIPFGERDCFVRPPAVADAFEVTLPAAPLPDGQPKARITLVVQDAAGRPLPGCRVDLWHVGVQSADAAEVVAARTDESGQVVTEVVAGQLGLEVAPPTAAEVGTPPAFGVHRRDLVVGADQAERVVVQLSRWPTIRIRPADGVPSVTLVTRYDAWSFDVEPDVEREIAVPGDEPFALRSGGVVVTASTRYYSFEAPPTEVVEIAPHPPTQLRLRVVDARGAPVAARVGLLDRDSSELPGASSSVPTAADGRAVLTTELVGCAFVRIVPDGPGPRRRDVHVGLPRLGEGPLELGDVVLPDAPALRVFRADGSVARGTFELRRPGLHWVGQLAEDGGWDGPALQAGDRVEAWLDRGQGGGAAAVAGAADVEVLRIPLATTLTGDGPWTLREGSARLRLTVVDDYGLFAEGAVVLYGSDAEWLSHHTIELHGLPAGPCEFFVGARSCDSAKVRLVLREGEQRALDVVLRRRT